jgi:hypothetical protein
MRIIVNHDASGRIRSVTSFDAPSGVTLQLRPAPGDSVSEIDGHGLAAKPDERALRDFARTHTVVDPIARRTVVQKVRK